MSFFIHIILFIFKVEKRKKKKRQLDINYKLLFFKNNTSAGACTWNLPRAYWTTYLQNLN